MLLQYVGRVVRRLGSSSIQGQLLLSDGPSVTYRTRPSAPIVASPMIGLILGTDRITWRPTTVQVVDAFSRATSGHGVGLTLVTDSSEPNESLRNFTSDGRVAGVVIRAQAADRRWVRELPAAGVPTVMLGAHRLMTGIHMVEIETVESTAALVGSMLDAGGTRLAMIGGPADRLDAAQRVEGFRLAHLQRGLVCDRALVFPGDYSRRSAYDIADEVLDARPDGIFAANDEMARGVMERAEQRGISVPDDLMMAGFDGIGDYAIDSHDLATVHAPIDALATIAVETLLGLIAGMDMPCERLVDPTVHLGTTIGSGSKRPARSVAQDNGVVRSAALEGLA